MQNFQKVSFSLLILSFLFSACGNSDSNSSTRVYPTAIGEAASVTTDEEGATMQPNPNSVSKMGLNVANILKTHLREHNKQEAIIFQKALHYCDISGEEHSAYNEINREEILETTEYTVCQKNYILQNGTIDIQYMQTDDNGQFPQSIVVDISNNDYVFNHLTLKKGFHIEANDIQYTHKEIRTFQLNITGSLREENSTISVKNMKQIINF